jgi:hypothetical protein
MLSPGGEAGCVEGAVLGGVDLDHRDDLGEGDAAGILEPTEKFGRRN